MLFIARIDHRARRDRHRAVPARTGAGQQGRHEHRTVVDVHGGMGGVVSADPHNWYSGSGSAGRIAVYYRESFTYTGAYTADMAMPDDGGGAYTADMPAVFNINGGNNASNSSVEPGSIGTFYLSVTFPYEPIVDGTVFLFRQCGRRWRGARPAASRRAPCSA
jgi:hypothetical protein